MVADEWQQTAFVRTYVELDAFVVMPNHIHGIIVITDNSPIGRPAGSPLRKQSTTLQSGSLGAIIGQFKSRVTKRARQLTNPPDYRIWQRNYYEHIIRNETTLNRIRAYIANNPAKWAEDSLFATG